MQPDCPTVKQLPHYRAANVRLARAERALSRPVHLRRARHGLARQQQHRRIDARPDGARTARPAVVDRRRGRNRRYRCHVRQVPAPARHLHQVVRRGPRGLGFPPVLPGPSGGGRRVAYRGHRPAAGGAVVRAGRRGPDAWGPGAVAHATNNASAQAIKGPERHQTVPGLAFPGCRPRSAPRSRGRGRAGYGGCGCRSSRRST